MSIKLRCNDYGYECDLVLDEELTVGKYLESKLEEEWMTYKLDIALEDVGLEKEINEKNSDITEYEAAVKV